MCLACPTGTYRPTADGEHTEETCIVDPGCGDGEVVSTKGDATKPTICAAAAACTPEQYESKPAIGGRNRECTPLRVCTTKEYQLAAPTTTSNRRCTVVSDCQRGQFEHQAPSKTSDRECFDCDPESFEWAGRVHGKNPSYCRDFSFCGRNMWVKIRGTQTSDLICAQCPSGQYRNELEHRYEECETPAPTPTPTGAPTKAPTTAPTDSPTSAPTLLPSSSPTYEPTPKPTAKPTTVPTKLPSVAGKEAGAAATTDASGDAQGSTVNDKKDGGFGTSALVAIAILIVVVIAVVAIVVVVVMKRKAAIDESTGRPGEESFSNPMYDSMTSAVNPANASQAGATGPSGGLSASSGYMDVMPTPASSGPGHTNTSTTAPPAGSSGYMDVAAARPTDDDDEDV